jgi:hypothetical protein
MIGGDKIADIVAIIVSGYNPDKGLDIILENRLEKILLHPSGQCQ